MADYYYDAAAAGAGSGTQADPYRSLSSGPSTGSHRRFLKGDFFVLDADVMIPDGWMDANNSELRSWGSARARVSGLRTVAPGSWTYDGATGTYWTPVSRGGIALRGGLPLKVCHLTQGSNTRPAGVANMVANSYLWDYVNGRIYIKITGGLADSPLQISTTNFGVRPSVGGATRTGLVIDGLIIEGASVHGVGVGGCPAMKITNSIVRFIGGARSNSGYYYGNGIEFGYGSDGLVIDGCEVAYCYDSGISPQLYNGVSAALNGYTVRNSNIHECGLAGIEASTQGSGGIVRSGVHQKNEVHHNGYGASSWADSSNSNGEGIDFRGQGAAGSYVTDMTVDNCYLHDNRCAMTVVNRTGAADSTRVSIVNGTRITNPGGTQPTGIEAYAEYGSAGLSVTMKGGVLAKIAAAIVTAGFAGGATAVALRNVSVIDNTAVVQRDSSGLTATLRNCLLQGNGSIGAGTGGSLTGNYNALRRTAVGSYQGGAADQTLLTDVQFDDTVWYIPVAGSPIYALAGEAQSPTYTDAFGASFATTSWPRNGYAAHAVPAASGALPSSRIIVRMGDSIMRGSDASGGVNEATYVSPWGYIVSALQAAGIAVTCIGVEASKYLTQPVRNGNAAAPPCAAQGASTLREAQAPYAGNSVETNIALLAADNPGVAPDDIFMDVGTNDLTAGIDATGTLLPAKIQATVAQIRAAWPNVKITCGIIPATYTKAVAQAGLDWLNTWANGTSNVVVDFYSIGYDPAGADGIGDGTHPSNQGAQKLATAFTTAYLASFATGGGSSGGGSSGGGTGGGTGGTTTPSTVALLNTPAPATNNATGTAATVFSLAAQPAGTLLVATSGTRRGGTTATVATTDSENNGYSAANRLADIYGAANIRSTLSHAFKTGAGAISITDTMSDGGLSQYAGVALAFSGLDPAVGMVDSGSNAAADTDGTTGTLTVTTDGSAAQVGDLVLCSAAVAPTTGTNAAFSAAGCSVVTANGNWDAAGIPGTVLAWKVATVAGQQSITLTYAAGAHVSGGVIKVIRAKQISGPSISTTSLPGGTVGVAYSQSVAATGNGTLTWSVLSGALPDGLTLNSSNGAITGTPTTAGTSTFTIQVAGTTGTPATQSLSITIAAAATPPKPTILNTTLPTGVVGAAYSAQLSVQSLIPVTWTLGSGKPAWLSIDGATGVLSGIPAASGDFTVPVIATSTSGATTVNLLLHIDPAPAAGGTIASITKVGSSAVLVSNGAYQMVVVQALDTNGTPVVGATLSGSVAAGLTLINATAVTDAQGQAAFLLQGSALGISSLNVTG